MRGKTTKIMEMASAANSGVAFTILNTLQITGKLNILQDFLVSDCHIDLNNQFQKWTLFW